MGFDLDLKGRKFGTLLILEYAGKCKSNKTLWLAECDCGNRNTYRTGNLQSGQATTCRFCQNTEHGHTKDKANKGLSPTYNTWRCMLMRCTDPNNVGYKYYGGRGVMVCDGWKVFTNFLSDMGERPKNHTLDRINPNGNYEPGNCRWATNKEQALNKRPHDVWNKGLKMPFKQRKSKSQPDTK